MKITIVIPNVNLSGGIRIVADQARMLHLRGHEVCVVAGRRREPSVKDRVKQLLRGQLPKRKPRIGTHLDEVAFEVRVIDECRDITAADVPDADIIMATWWKTAHWVEAMPASKGIKVNFIQGYDVHPDHPSEPIEAVWRMDMQKIVVSDWLRRIALDRFGDDSAILVPNGIDCNAFAFDERSKNARAMIGVVSSTVPCKRFWIACEVVEELRRRGLDCGFVGFGTGKLSEEDLPDGSEFEVAPSAERISEVYRSCDCWLFTSDEEGYGLPIVEALASGTPVVATPAGAARELLSSGGGVLVDEDDPDRIVCAVADGVERVLSLDDGAWRAMARAGRVEAERHSWDVIGGRMESVLLRLLDEHRK